MNPIVTTVTLAAAASTGIFSAVIAAAGTLTLSGSLVSGGVATMDNQRKISAVSTNVGDTTQTLTYTGTNASGAVISEKITLNGTTAVVSVLDYKTVTKIVAGGSGYATAGTINIGTNANGSTPWFLPDREMTPFSVAAAIQTGSGTTANLDYTYDDPNLYTMTGYPYGSVNPNSITPPVVWAAASPLNSVVATKADANLVNPVFAYRMTITAGTNAATLWLSQTGIV